jgi:hypothetical protein
MARLALEAGRGDLGGVLERLEEGDDIDHADGVRNILLLSYDMCACGFTTYVTASW